MWIQDSNYDPWMLDIHPANVQDVAASYVIDVKNMKYISIFVLDFWFYNETVDSHIVDFLNAVLRKLTYIGPK